MYYVLKENLLEAKIRNLKILSLSNDNSHVKMRDFSNLSKLTDINLSNNSLWSEDLKI